MEHSETLFLLHIMDGYSFRNAIGIVKSETDYATMILSPRTIEISFANRSGGAMHKIVINADELTRYIYNIRDADGYLLPEHPVAFETNAMFNTTKGIGKRDGIRLYCLDGDTKINVQPLKTSSKDPGRAEALFVPIENREYQRMEIGNFCNPEPNVRVQAKAFADICIQANTVKASNLEIIGESNAVTFKGMLPNNTMASINKFVSQVNIPYESMGPSNMDEIDNLLGNLRVRNTTNGAPSGISLNVVKSNELANINVPQTTYKSLSKIHNISPQGTHLKFFFVPTKPIKIESALSTYGTYTVCLRKPPA